MSLEDLRKSLLYNDVMDVWIALCEERGWNWNDFRRYFRFLEHLHRAGVSVNELGVCAQERGKKAALVRAISRLRDTPLRTQVVRLDERVIAAARGFESAS
jgi:hypothetical protein